MPLDVIDYLWLASPITFGVALTGMLPASRLLNPEYRSADPELRRKTATAEPPFWVLFAIGSAVGVLTLFVWLIGWAAGAVTGQQIAYPFRVLVVAVPYLFVAAAVGFHAALLAKTMAVGLERVPGFGGLRARRERAATDSLLGKLFAADLGERGGAATALADARPAAARGPVRAALADDRVNADVVRVFAAFEQADGVAALCALAARNPSLAGAAVRALAGSCGAAGAEAVLRLFEQSTSFADGCGRAAVEQLVASGGDDAWPLVVRRMEALHAAARYSLYRMVKFHGKDAFLECLPLDLWAETDQEFDRRFAAEVLAVVRKGTMAGDYVRDEEAPRLREAERELAAIPDHLVVRPLVAGLTASKATMREYSRHCDPIRTRLERLADPRAVELLCQELARPDSPARVPQDRMAKERYTFQWLEWGATSHGYVWVRLHDGADARSTSAWFVRSPSVVLKLDDVGALVYKAAATWLDTPYRLRPDAGALMLPTYDAKKKAESDEAFARAVAAWAFKAEGAVPVPRAT